MNISEEFKKLNDIDKVNYILSKDENGSYKFNEEERYELSKLFNNNSYVSRTIVSLNDIEKIKELMTGLDDYSKKFIITSKDNNNNYKYSEKERFELAKLVSENQRYSIIDSFHDDSVIVDSISLLESDPSYVIKKIKDEDIRLNALKDYKDKLPQYKKVDVMKTFSPYKVVQNISLFDLSNYQIKELIISKDKNNNYVFSEEERFNLLDLFDNKKDINNVKEIVLTLSDGHKVSDKVKHLLDGYMNDIITTITDDNLIKKEFKLFNKYDKIQYLNNPSLDKEKKIDLINSLDNEEEIMDIFSSLLMNKNLDDNMLVKLSRCVKMLRNKCTIIDNIQDEKKKLDSLIECNSYIDEAKNRLNKSDELNLSIDEKAPLLSNIMVTPYLTIIRNFNPILVVNNAKRLGLDNDFISKFIIENGETLGEEVIVEHLDLFAPYTLNRILPYLSDDNKFCDKILSKLNEYEVVHLLESTNDPSFIVSKLEEEKIKNKLSRYFDYSLFIRDNIFKTDEDKINLLRAVDDEEQKAIIISKLTSDEKKLEYVSEILKVTNQLIVMFSIKDKNKKVKAFTEYIYKVNDLNDLLFDINSININDSFINETKAYIEKLIKGEDICAKLVSRDDFELYYQKLNPGSKRRVMHKKLNNSINDYVKLKYIDSFASEEDRLRIIKAINNIDNKINAYEKAPFTKDEYKMGFLSELHGEYVSKYINILSEAENKFIIANNNYGLRRDDIVLHIENYKEEFNNLFDNGKYNLVTDYSDYILDRVYTDKKKRLVVEEYNKFTRESIKDHFSEYIYKHYNDLKEEDISTISTLVFSIDTSNSVEVSKKANEFLDSILSSDKPLESFSKVENIFLQNHLPYFAKAYLTFLTVHPDFESYNFKNSNKGNNSVTSPVLNESSLLHKKTIILSDLIKCSLKSNNREFRDYLSRLRDYNNVYINNTNNSFDSLSDNDKEILTEFRDTLFTIYSTSLYKNNLTRTNDIIGDIKKVEEVFKRKDSYKSLPDEIVSSYCHFIGINSIEEALNTMDEEVVNANARNIIREKNKDFTINKGDFVKGFNINYFFDMIQSGIVAKDFLGANMDTDMTALDTDLSRISKDTEGLSIKEILDMKNNDSGRFGQGYIVIKDDPSKISITKNDSENQRLDEVKKDEFFSDKLEAFANSSPQSISTAYGIRTGFASSYIDYIIFDEEAGTYKENLNKITLPIAMNGTYIPVISNETLENGKVKVLFSKDDYDKLRSKMNGLSYYGINKFNISNNIDSPVFRDIASQIDDSSKIINNVKSEIIKEMSEGLGNDYNVITYINGKITKDELQVLDTGSTSRGTNVPYDGDYDFVVRVNREIDIDNNLKNEFIKKLTSKFDVVNPGRVVNGDLKEMIIKIDGKEVPLDLSFTRKTDKVSYSTEMCVSDRLNTIKKEHPDKYKLVLANIIYAKKFLKENSCYKKGSYGQGGLGGIGVENWILQNGGSFYDAANDFLKTALDEKGNIIPFEEFTSKYSIWDFGENFYTDRINSQKGVMNNLHDNFISNNMTKEGYEKMCTSLKKLVYSSNYEISNINEEESTIKL